MQVAAVYCVLNLVNTNDEGAFERQLKLKDIGAHKILQKLLHSTDPVLFDKVKNTLQHFSSSLAASAGIATNTSLTAAAAAAHSSLLSTISTNTSTNANNQSTSNNS